MPEADTGPSATGVPPGELLRHWRERALLTQEQLAERARVNVRTIRRLESDTATRPRIATLRQVMDALDLDASQREAMRVAIYRMPAAGADETESSMRPVEVVVPRQLPAPPPGFTGRVRELARMGRDRERSDVVVTVIDGMAGVGKTALALHAAHQLAVEYPDGQLFLDLHGHTSGMPPVQPAEALDRLLRTLGVPGKQIPEHVEDRAALYRGRLAGRKILIVLDNAADEQQVEPLLPGSGACLALVTSRRRLSGLNHTSTVSLDVLPVPDGVALLNHAAALDGSADPVTEAADEVVRLCGGLPLAIRIAAARLRTRPSWSVAHLAQRLKDRQEWLGELSAGSRSVTAALDLSVHQLRAEARRAYRLCGLHAGSGFERYAAAALIDTTTDAAERQLGELLDVNLLQEPVPGRYVFHDLVRAHAVAEAKREESDEERLQAYGRMFGHYGNTASAAMDLAYPYERERRPPRPPARTPAPELNDSAGAMAWLDAELPNLLTAARYAAEFCPEDHAFHLAATVDRHLVSRDRYSEAEAMHLRGMTVARRLGDLAGQADMLTRLGHDSRRRGRSEEATERLERALAIARSGGSDRVLADALLGLGNILALRGSHESAAAHLGLALDTARRTGHRAGEMEVLLRLGWLHMIWQAPASDAEPAPATRHERASSCFEEALAIARATGNPLGEVYGLLGRGWVHRLEGRHGAAAAAYREALGLARRLGNVSWEFEALEGIGRLDTTTGHADRALVRHERTLELATDLRQPVDRARAHDGLARAYHALHQHEDARRHWRTALDILDSIGTNITVDEEVNTTQIRARLRTVEEAREPSSGRPESADSDAECDLGAL